MGAVECTLMDLFTCQSGYEPLLEAELARQGARVATRGPGWVGVDGGTLAEPCYAHLRLRAAAGLTAGSVNAQAAALLDLFLAGLGDARLPEPWPLVFRFSADTPGLGPRAGAVAQAFRERLKKRAGRLARTGQDALPRGGGEGFGLFVFFAGFDRIFAAVRAWSGGQQRMADDPAAPSRSYLKCEEAYALLGREPRPGEAVIDLGAAPGGWSYSAAKRGARVLAIDNGPLKDGARGHPLIEHRRADAFTFRLPPGEACDWLFCDLVEEPHHVLRLVARWLRERRGLRFIVNLKLGRADGAGLLEELREPHGRLLPPCPLLRIRHLFHDRDEITLVGHTP